MRYINNDFGTIRYFVIVKSCIIFARTWLEVRIPNIPKTEKYKRSNQKTGWKTHGMKLYEGETWDQIYDIYWGMTECNGCARPFQTDEKRCLDHNHDTGFIRGVLCYSCNKLDILKDV